MGGQQSLTKPAPFPGKIQQDKALSVAHSFEPIKLPKKSIDVFLSYTHQDEELHNQLAQQLKSLQRQGLIGALYDQEIRPGRHWSRDIDIHLNVANLILLLISPDYVASGYIYEGDLRRAINRHESGEARVIPIILRPTDWSGTPLGKLPILPRNAEPITMWHNLEEALLDVARSVRRVVEELAATP